MRLLLRILGLLFVLYAALSIIRGLIGAVSTSRPLRHTASGGRLMKDPICGTYIPEGSAFKAQDQFFCSETCREKFLKA